jgi:hypothetical protein
MTLMEGNQIAKKMTRVSQQLAEELDSFREEIRIQREIGRRERQ